MGPMIDEYGGRIVGTAGDSLLVTIPSTADAVSCFLQVQAVVAERNSNVSHRKRMVFRVGVNSATFTYSGQAPALRGSPHNGAFAHQAFQGRLRRHLTAQRYLVFDDNVPPA